MMNYSKGLNDSPESSSALEADTYNFYGCGYDLKDLELMRRPSGKYQFFSDDGPTMCQFSSNWFSGEEGLKEKKEPPPKCKRVEWFSEETVNYYDIGYAEKLSLYKVNKKGEFEMKKLEPLAPARKLTLNTNRNVYRNAQLIEIKPQKDSAKTATALVPKIEKMDHIDTTEPSAFDFASTNYIDYKQSLQKNVKFKMDTHEIKRMLRSDHSHQKEIKFTVAKGPDDYLSKIIATSRFGRTRKVIDFASVAEIEGS